MKSYNSLKLKLKLSHLHRGNAVSGNFKYTMLPKIHKVGHVLTLHYPPRLPVHSGPYLEGSKRKLSLEISKKQITKILASFYHLITSLVKFSLFQFFPLPHQYQLILNFYHAFSNSAPLPCMPHQSTDYYFFFIEV